MFNSPNKGCELGIMQHFTVPRRIFLNRYSKEKNEDLYVYSGKMLNIITIPHQGS